MMLDPEHPEVDGVASGGLPHLEPRLKALRIRGADLTAVAIIGLLAIIATSIGFVPVVIYSHDVFIPLDGAWRVLNGQRPHTDFATSLGPVFYLVEAGGLALAGRTAKGLAYASTITSTLVAVWAYVVSRRRLTSGASVAFAVLIFVLTFAPVALGDPDPTWHTYAMEYTRWGVSLMCILLVESVVSESSSHAGGLSTGIICALLLFLKVNLFVIAAGLVGMSLLLNWDVRRFRGMAVGFFLVAAAIATYLRFNLAAMWRDFRMAAEGRGTSVSVSRLISLMELNWFTLVITMLLAVFIASDKKAEDLKSRYRYPILCLAVFGASALLLITNFQPSAMPLGVVFALICCSRLYTLWKHGRHLKSMASMWLVFCASGFIMYSMGIDTMSIVHAGVLRHFSGRFLLTPFDADALSPFVTFGPKDPPERPVDGQWLVQYVNDGLALLRENTSPWDSVVSLDYANPFSFALKRPPNEGGAVWLAFGDPTFRYNPEPSMILGRAAVVMIPKWPTAIRSDFEGGLRVYGTYVKEHFNKAAESKLWILEKRNEVP